jgi:hypothetical protein
MIESKEVAWAEAQAFIKRRPGARYIVFQVGNTGRWCNWELYGSVETLVANISRLYKFPLTDVQEVEAKRVPTI